MELARRIAGVGVGEPRYGRRSSRGLAALRREAACAALTDAGLEAAAVDGLIVPGAGYAELHELARDLGIRGQFHAASCFHSGTAVGAAPPPAGPPVPGRPGRPLPRPPGASRGDQR